MPRRAQAWPSAQAGKVTDSQKSMIMPVRPEQGATVAGSGRKRGASLGSGWCGGVAAVAQRQMVVQGEVIKALSAGMAR